MQFAMNAHLFDHVALADDHLRQLTANAAIRLAASLNRGYVIGTR